MRFFSILAIGAALLTAPAFANDTVEMPVKLDSTGFRDVLAKTGDVYISGQPSEEGLEKLAKDGVKTVVSFRTAREMDDRDIVPFDEAAKAQALGMKYVHIPLGGPDTPYTPDALEAFAKVMAEQDGKTLIHCTVAWRASHMWAAYLAKYKGLDINEAVAHGRAVNMSTQPLEALLGGEVTYSLPATEDR